MDFDEDVYWRFSADDDDIDDSTAYEGSFSHSSFEGSSNDKNLVSERMNLALEFRRKQNDLEQ
jgi:hypothetical protein